MEIAHLHDCTGLLKVITNALGNSVLSNLWLVLMKLRLGSWKDRLSIIMLL